MKVIQGDLIQLALEGRFDAIIHGCNCQCVMGAGIAKSIRVNFPEAYEADLTTKSIKPEVKLGTFTYGHVARDGVSFRVINAYTQLNY